MAATPLVAQAQPPRDYGTGASPVRYPEPDVIVLDARFNKYKIGSAPIRRLHTGLLWAEGPAWNAVGRFVLWSDIPNDVQMRYLLDDGHVSTFRKPAQNSNGNTFDFQGRQVACEHGTRRVVRYEHDGSVTVLADKFDGKIFNAPNDVVVHPSGAIYFTDPGYGSLGNYEGNKGELLLKEAVYRIDTNGKIEKLLDTMHKPNGLCFSPDYKKLYIADSGDPHNIMVWNVEANGKLSGGKEFVHMKLSVKGKDVIGIADGIRADRDGNIWSSAGWAGEGFDGVHIFAPDATRIGQILLPEICSNVCFCGPKRNWLVMTASQSVYAVYVEAQGAHIS